jgi:translation initiation factor IF-2
MAADPTIPSPRSSRAVDGVSAITASAPGSSHRSTGLPAARSWAPHAQVHGRHQRAAVAARREPGRRQHGPDPRRSACVPGPLTRRSAHAALRPAPSPAAAPGPAGPARITWPCARNRPGPRARPAAMSPPAGPRPADPGTGQLGDTVYHPPIRSQATQPDDSTGRSEHRAQAQHPQHALHAGRRHSRPVGSGRQRPATSRPAEPLRSPAAPGKWRVQCRAGRLKAPAHRGPAQ